MSPTRPENPEAAAAKKRITEAGTHKDENIENAHRAFWAAVDAEIKAKNLTQTAVAEHLGFSREHVRKQLIRYAS